MLHNLGNSKLCTFLIQSLPDKPLLLNLLASEEFQNPERTDLENDVKTLAARYSLLNAVKNGDTDLFVKLWNPEAPNTFRDFSMPEVTFTLQGDNGQLLTYHDLLQPQLSLPLHLTAYPQQFLGKTDQYGNVWDIADFRMHFNIIEKMLSHDMAWAKDDENVTWAKNYLSHKFQEDQKKLLEAQKSGILPRFSIEPHTTPPLEKSNFQITSKYNPALQLQAYITHDKVELRSETPDTAWKRPYLDIDALSQVCATVISLNDLHGKKVINNIKVGDPYKTWRYQLFNHLLLKLENQFYHQEPLIMENFVLLSKKITNQFHDLKIPSFNNVEKALFTLLLRFCHDQSQNNKELPHYNDLLKIFITRPIGKTFLKELCDDKDEVYMPSNHILLNPSIKPFIKTTLWRNILVRSLTQADPPFLSHIAENIAQYWEPTKEFIEAFFQKSESPAQTNAPQ
jgi:hypothetical protein